MALLAVTAALIAALDAGGAAGAVPPRAVHRAPAGAGRVTSLALCDFGGLSAAHPAFVASHFSWVVLGGGTPATVAELHRDDPSIRVLYYFNSLFASYSAAAGYGPSAFLSDPELGKRLVSMSSAPGLASFPVYVMDPGSPAWLADSEAAVSKALAEGYDGVMLDDVMANLLEAQPAPMPEGGPAYRAPPSWYDAAKYRADVRAYLAAMTAFVRPKTVVFNGLSATPGNPELPFTAVTDGAIEEGWVYDDRYGADYATGTRWADIVGDVASVPAGKRFAVIAYGPDDLPAARLYALGSYLLVARPSSTFSYSPSCTSLGYFPEFGAPLGAPEGTVRSLSGLTRVRGQVYERRFANGLVLVNPATTPARPVTLGGTCREVVATGGLVPSLGGNGAMILRPTASVALGPHSAAILVDCRRPG
jgi:hypothetical protein